MPDSTYEQLVKQCEGHRDALEFAYIHSGEEWSDVIEAAAQAGITAEEVCDTDDDEWTVSVSAIVGGALDVEIYGRYNFDGSASDWQVTEVHVLFTTGGPHVYFTTRDNTVRGSWGGDEVIRSVSGDVGRYIEETTTEGLS